MQSQTPQSEPEVTAETPLWSEVLGWLGTLAILGAYMGTSLGWFEQGRAYQLLNLFGAIGVGQVCWLRRTWQPFALEAVWGLIALTALLRG